MLYAGRAGRLARAWLWGAQLENGDGDVVQLQHAGKSESAEASADDRYGCSREILSKSTERFAPSSWRRLHAIGVATFTLRGRLGLWDGGEGEASDGEHSFGGTAVSRAPRHAPHDSHQKRRQLLRLNG